MLPVDRNFGLDLGRATAIMLVLLAHFVKKVDFLGFWGVELFFSLSGFLIGGILWRDLLQPDLVNFKYIFNFWLRRWYRTLPNYYLFLLIMIVFHQYISVDLKSYYTVFTSLWFGQNFLGRNSNFFGVSWSLCIEEWFYVLFPILLLVGNLIGFKKQKLLILTSIFLILFSIIVRYMFFIHNSNISLRAITLARMDAIVYGVIVAYFSTEVYKKKSFHIISLFLGIIGIFLNLLFLKKNQPIQESYLLIFAPLSCALILPALTHISVSTSIFLPFKKVIENISLWSYSIYLSHIPILMTVYMIMGPFRNSFISIIITKFIGLILTFFIASIVYNKFEQPILRLRPKSLKHEAFLYS